MCNWTMNIDVINCTGRSKTWLRRRPITETKKKLVMQNLYSLLSKNSENNPVYKQEFSLFKLSNHWGTQRSPLDSLLPACFPLSEKPLEVLFSKHMKHFLWFILNLICDFNMLSFSLIYILWKRKKLQGVKSSKWGGWGRMIMLHGKNWHFECSVSSRIAV